MLKVLWQAITDVCLNTVRGYTVCTTNDLILEAQWRINWHKKIW
jgi:hypothetical protein